MIEWIDDEPRMLGRLGQNGERIRQLEAEVQSERSRLSTSEKILVASLFLNILTFAWTIYRTSPQEAKQ
jgi:cell division protein FtsL